MSERPSAVDPAANRDGGFGRYALRRPCRPVSTGRTPVIIRHLASTEEQLR